MIHLFLKAVQFTFILLIVQRCHGQRTVDGFMPGSSPATANNALSTCQKQAVSKQLNINYTGRHAALINSWCSSYEDILPCLGKVLLTANNADDWFLKLTFDEAKATAMSKTMCAKFPYMSNLTCVDEDKEKVAKCMTWNTKSAIDHYYSLIAPNQPFTLERRGNASVYACIVTVATAGCFHRELTSCPEEKRKLLYDYYILLSSKKCREIAGIPEVTTQEVSFSTSTPQQSTSAILSNTESASRDQNINNGGNPGYTERGSNNMVTRNRNRQKQSNNNDNNAACDSPPRILTVLLLLLAFL